MEDYVGFLDVFVDSQNPSLVNTFVAVVEHVKGLFEKTPLGPVLFENKLFCAVNVSEK